MLIEEKHPLTKPLEPVHFLILGIWNWGLNISVNLDLAKFGREGQARAKIQRDAPAQSRQIAEVNVSIRIWPDLRSMTGQRKVYNALMDRTV